MASTYPRWPGDSTRSFVQDYVNAIAAYFRNVRVIVPHYAGAKHREQSAPNIRLSRFYYAFPFRFENIAYGEFRKTIGYPIKAVLYNASELWSTLLAGWRWRPVVLNPHWLLPQGFVAVLLKPVLGCKVVVSVHGADVYTLNGKFMKKIKRFVLSRADEVVVNSSATLAVCQRLWKRDYHVIPMGIDTDLFKPRGKKQASAVLEVLFVGRLAEEKGVWYLCEAARLLKERGHKVHTTIIGDGSLRKDLEAFVAEHGLEQEVTFTGGIPHSQLPAYYAAADVFVGPSIESKNGWQEAFGLVFAEASASSLPVIATNTGGIQDVIKNGINGLIVPQKDAAAIANAVTKLQNDPQLARKLGAAGPDYIRQNFSWQVITDKYLALFEAIL
ncbi:MAG TPA: glycosyltransferase [Candidatus Saccharimonadales bacterium]|nr:glycosyltransferase [Candidatus Saccharimonadales bacterium]